MTVPTNISDLVAWWDNGTLSAAAGSQTEESSIESWSDSSGNENSADTPYGTDEELNYCPPSQNVAELWCVDFGPVNYGFVTPVAATLTSFTWVAVAGLDPPSGPAVLFCSSQVGGYGLVCPTRHAQGTSFQLVQVGAGEGGADVVIGESDGVIESDDLPFLLVVTYDSESGDWAFRIDGAAAGSGNSAVGAYGGGSLNLGYDPNSETCLAGYGIQFLVYGRVLNSSEISGLSSYLGWGASGPVTVSPPHATATAAGLAPTVTGQRVVSVSPPVATASAAMLAPTVTTSGGAVTVSPPAATASAAGLVPTVVGQRVVSVSAPVATASAAMLVPTVFGQKQVTVSAPVAAATAAGLAPTVAGQRQVTVSVPVAGAAADAWVLSVVGQRVVSVSAPAGTATAAGVAPTVSIVYVVNVSPPAAGASAVFLSPTVVGQMQVSVSPPAATAVARFVAPWLGVAPTVPADRVAVASVEDRVVRVAAEDRVILG